MEQIIEQLCKDFLIEQSSHNFRLIYDKFKPLVGKFHKIYKVDYADLESIAYETLYRCINSFDFSLLDYENGNPDGMFYCYFETSFARATYNIRKSTKTRLENIQCIDSLDGKRSTLDNYQTLDIAKLTKWLSDKEKEYVYYILDGYSTKDLPTIMNISGQRCYDLRNKIAKKISKYFPEKSIGKVVNFTEKKFKATQEIRIEILEKYSTGNYSFRTLAEEYGCNSDTIKAIIRPDWAKRKYQLRKQREAK